MSREAWTAILVLGAIVALASLVGAIVLAVRVWRTRALLGELGVAGKWAFYGALVYTIFPVDVLPDPIYLDDMGVLGGALLYLTHLVHKHRTARAGSQPGLPRQPRPPSRPERRPL